MTVDPILQSAALTLANPSASPEQRNEALAVFDALGLDGSQFPIDKLSQLGVGDVKGFEGVPGGEAFLEQAGQSAAISNDAFAPALDAGQQMNVAMETSAHTGNVDAKDIDMAKLKIDQLAHQIMAENPSISASELQAKMAGQIPNAGNIPQNVIADLVEDAHLKNQDPMAMMNNTPAQGMSTQNAAEEEKGGLFAGMKEMLAPIIATLGTAMAAIGFGGKQGEEVSLAALGDLSPPQVGGKSREQSIGIS